MKMKTSHSAFDFLSQRKSNLESFLESVTPVVPSKAPSMSNVDDGEGEYFTLGELWESYEEWSAYGAGAPITLKHNENVMQYYAPFLSAIQIYTVSSPSSLLVRNSSSGDEIEVTDFEMESWSDGSDNSEKLGRSLSNNSISADSSSEREGSRDRLGYLYFQHCETNPPYWRTPFVEKMFEFAETHRGLEALKSTELSAASWMAVAWYPIYHVPMKGPARTISASFLTYHTLSSSFQDSWEESANSGTDKDSISSERNGEREICLRPFGLASHRMNQETWLSCDPQDYEKLADLQSAADSWLKQLSYQHHDFTFFATHSNFENGFPF